ncbi:riboflavin synthase [Marinoscillum sp. MHG1-6]|uniref:riboflavin synthase n=1 Tax=Marinoscillum sp. MHG1-6 TaxID=2959627 RepID=UPI002157EB03|nr:riboflavin synthase [Marinoscillum sp. MHG1-6]
MFTGIIEVVGEIIEKRGDGTNLHLKINSSISEELKIDQSVSHNGICLTVTAVEEGSHWVTAIDETLSKTNLNNLEVGSKVNLERCMIMNGRFDGHIVQGHVDTVAKVVKKVNKDGSWQFTFTYPEEKGFMVEKGSVCVNGVSLTCFNIKSGQFDVAIIPYTLENTNFLNLAEEDYVNVEFDIIGKYIENLLLKRNQ